MRIQLSRRGIWLIDRSGSARRHRWHVLAPLIVLPLLFAAFLALSINRSIPFARLLRRSPVEGAQLYGEFSRTSIENLLALQPPQTTSQLPTLELFVPKNTLDAMHVANISGDPELGHDPGGDRPYYKAYFRDESGQMQKSKIAYRGLMHYHHWPEKPSLRVKIKKAEIARGQRYVELSRPKDVLAFHNQLPEVLAKELGIVTTLNEQVRLFVNNKYYGVYLRSHRPGEALALASGRMPGTFFKGDLVSQTSLNEHLDLWESSKLWKIFGEAADADVALFNEFLATLRRRPTPSSFARLEQLLDTECLAKWAAIMVVTGCVHTDARHNQTYFYCTNQGKFEIMPWDPTLYEVAGRDFTPVDTINHPVTGRMIRDPRWVHRRNEYILRLIEGAASSDSLCRHVDEQLARVIADLQADPNLSKKATIGRGRVPSSIWDIDDEAESIKNWAVAKEKFLRDYLNDARVYVAADPDQAGHSLVHVFGTVAVTAATQDGRRLKIRDAGGGNVELLYPGLAEKLGTAVFQPHDIAKKLPCAQPAPLVYQIDAPPAELVFHNAVTGRPVDPVNDPPQFHGKVRTLSASTLRGEPWGKIVLGPGEVVLTEDLHVGRRQTCTIQPGTTLRLRAGAGIYARGRLIARGTPSAPIRIEPFDSQPWAAIGLSGAATAGSLFEYVSVADGSIGADGGLRYKGMFNVYDCPSIVIRHCEFGANHVGDDAVNLAESVIEVEHCNFNGARSDALDLDMCRGTVSNCRWSNSGNDGLDMMHCRVYVRDCEFDRCGDKGISVGEASRALVRDCRIARCNIGIEVKDDSRLVAQRCHFVDNGFGFHSYQKKWLFSRGGTSLIADSLFYGSRDATVDIEARSQLSLLRTSAESIKRGKRRLHTVDSLDAESAKLIAELEGL